MRKTLYVIGLTALLSFLGGLWWETNKHHGLPFQGKSPLSLEVLALEGVFPQTFLDDLRREENIELKVSTKTSSKELLLEILNEDHRFSLIVFPSFLTDSISFAEYFLPLNKSMDSAQYKTLLDKVSVDFLSLGKDPENKYLIPFLWGVNGWVLPPSFVSDRLSLTQFLESGAQKARLRLLPDPMEIYGVMTKVRPALKAWIELGNQEELVRGSQDLKAKIGFLDASGSTENDLIQVSSGQLTPELKSRFRLADEKSHLWVQYLTIPQRGGLSATDLSRLLGVLYSARWASQLAQATQMAHCSTALTDLPDLSENLKPSYIRQLSISRIDMISAHEAYEPTFMAYLKRTFPQLAEQ